MPANSTIGKYFGGDTDRLEVRLVLVLVGAGEPLRERAFAPERLHDAHPFEALLQRREVGGDPIAYIQVGEVRDAAEPAAREVDRRHDDQHAERELPRHQHDDDDRAHEQEDVLDEQHQALRDELLHRVDVGGHARHDLARVLPLEEVERERHQVIEQALAQLAQERLADPRDQQDRQATEEDGRERHEQVEHDRDVQRPRVVVRRARGRCRTAPARDPRAACPLARSAPPR